MSLVAQGTFCAMNGIDLSVVLKNVKIPGQAELKDCTVLADTEARKYKKALIERSVSGDGFFRASETTAEDANGLFKAALEAVSGDRLMLVGNEGSSVGAVGASRCSSSSPPRCNRCGRKR